MAVEPPTSERARRAIVAVRPTLEARLHAKGMRWGDPIYLRLFKEERVLELWVQTGGRWRLFETSPICSFSGGLGPKLREGDRKSPEGFYFVRPGAMNPRSRYHLSFNLGYPNAFDRAHGRSGSALMIHGDCVSVGCYAMTDAGIEPIYAMADAALRRGQPFFRVHVFPFRMTDEKLGRHVGSEWYSFWMNLKQGYDWFERHGRPPDVHVDGRRYAFSPVEGELP